MEKNELDEHNGLAFGQDDVEELEDDVSDDEGDDYPQGKEPEIPRSLPEESMADEPENPEGRMPKKRDKAQTRINQIQRDRYQALAALEEAKAENERLRQATQLSEQRAQLSTQAAMRHYDDNVNARLERARAMQISAIESGDAQAQSDAYIEVAAATTAIQELKNWKYKEEYERKFAEERTREQQAYQQQNSVQSYSPNEVVLEDWIDRNEWYDPSSENHDPDLSAAISKYANNLDYQLSNSGYGFRIKSPEYFQAIDEAKQQYIEQRNNRNSPTQGRSLNMRSPQGGAYSARNGRGAQAQAQRPGALTSDQRDMARRMGVTDKAYAESVKYCEANKAPRHGGN